MKSQRTVFSFNFFEDLPYIFNFAYKPSSLGGRQQQRGSPEKEERQGLFHFYQLWNVIFCYIKQ